MTRLLPLCALALVSGCGLGGIIGDGKQTTVSRDVGAFTKLSVEAAIEVTATEGPRAVTVTTDSNVERIVETVVQGDTLIVRLRDLASVQTSRPVRVTVANDRLASVTASGASSIDATGLFHDALTADASGASTLHLHTLATSDVTVSGTGASTITLDGASRTLSATVSGASTLEARGLSSQNAHVDVTGASKAIVRASASVTGTASGASTVIVAGAPTSVIVERSGASTMTVE